MTASEKQILHFVQNGNESLRFAQDDHLGALSFLYINSWLVQGRVARPAGVEPATLGLEGRCSVH